MNCCRSNFDNLAAAAIHHFSLITITINFSLFTFHFPIRLRQHHHPIVIQNALRNTLAFEVSIVNARLQVGDQVREAQHGLIDLIQIVLNASGKLIPRNPKSIWIITAVLGGEGAPVIQSP